MQEPFSVPEHAKHHGYCHQEDKNQPGTDDARLTVICGVEAQYSQRQGDQQREDQGQRQDDQVEGARRTDLLPTKPSHQQHDRGYGSQPRHRRGSNQGDLRVDQVTDSLRRAGLHGGGGLAEHVDSQRYEDHRQRDRDGDLELTSDSVGFPSALYRFINEQQSQKNRRFCHENIRGGFVNVVHGGDEGQPVEPLGLSVFHVAQEEPEHHQSPKNNEDLIARVAAVEKDIR